MQEIPLLSDPAQRFEIELNELRLFFTVRFNFAGSFWTFDLADSDKTLISGVTMLLGTNLFEPQRDLTETLGQIWMYDKTRSGLDATADNLGTDVIMLYFLPDEVIPLPVVEIVE